MTWQYINMRPFNCHHLAPCALPIVVVVVGGCSRDRASWLAHCQCRRAPSASSASTTAWQLYFHSRSLGRVPLSATTERKTAFLAAIARGCVRSDNKRQGGREGQRGCGARSQKGKVPMPFQTPLTAHLCACAAIVRDQLNSGVRHMTKGPVLPHD